MCEYLSFSMINNFFKQIYKTIKTFFLLAIVESIVFLLLLLLGILLTKAFNIDVLSIVTKHIVFSGIFFIITLFLIKIMIDKFFKELR